MITIPARYFYPGRTRRPIRVIVIHSMEAPEGPQTAENCARYFETIDGRKASAHVCVDNNSAVRCVDDDDTAFHAPGANSDGLGIEHAGFMRQSKADWLDAYGLAMLAISADVVAAWCREYDIPPVHLTVPQLLAGQRGLVGHADVSAAYHQTDHTDPGPGFPWRYYTALLTDRLEDDDMDQDQFTAYLLRALKEPEVKAAFSSLPWNQLYGNTTTTMMGLLGRVNDRLGTLLNKDGP